jgi:hypothetical protein
MPAFFNSLCEKDRGCARAMMRRFAASRRREGAIFPIVTSLLSMVATHENSRTESHARAFHDVERKKIDNLVRRTSRHGRY